MRFKIWVCVAAGALACAVVVPAVRADVPGPIGPVQIFDVGDDNNPANDLALSQPVVVVNVIDPATLENEGPFWSQPWLLDTGASGVFVAGGQFLNLDAISEEDLLTNAYLELQAANVDLNDGTIGEQGVGGVQEVAFSAPYTVNVTFDGATEVEISNVRMLANPNANFGGFAGIVGMPVMVDRVTSLDQSVWSGGLQLDDGSGGGDPFGDILGLFENLFMGVAFSDSVPAAPDPARRFAVPLHLKSFAYEGNPNPAPTNAPLPFANGAVTNGTTTIQTDMLIDTGAQLSLIDPDLAEQLGLGDVVFMDLDDDPLTPDDKVFLPFDDSLGTLTVGGVSGEVEAPLVTFDRLTLNGENGSLTNFNTVVMLVLEIDDEIPLIFGADFLTAGWFGALFDEGPDGNFDYVHFDFRNAAAMAGTMYLDFSAHAVPEPGVLLLIGLGGALLLPRRRRHHH